MYNDFKKAGIIHKLVNNKVKNNLKAGMPALEITEIIENEIKILTKFDEKQPLKAGIGFPVGISINDVAAHFTPCSKHNPIIQEDDVVKIDYGVHINGCISDGAFSWCPSGKYDDLIKISQEATLTGIKNSGPDAILGQIGGEIQEIIENSEIEINNKFLPIKSIGNLTGHKIQPFIIHAGKMVPNIRVDYFERMKEGEIYAVETFPTTGNGEIFNDKECNHFMINKIPKNNDKTSLIYDQRSTLPFCPRWFDFDIPDSKYITKYPVIKTKDKGIVAQYEKTIYIKNNGVEITN